MGELFEKSKDSGLDLPFLESDDVSEFAQIVGLKFEKVIKELDLGDKLNPVMKHVIYLLEQMDLMIKEKDDLQTSLANLENELNQFKHENKESKLEKLRCQNEFEQIEDTYRKENTDLLNLISKLKDDNLKLRDLVNKEKFEENDLKFRENVEGVEKCTQNLLINEKKKVQNLQKELESKKDHIEQLESQLEQEIKRTETLTKKLQKLKEENLILNQQIDFKDNHYDKHLELIEELKKQLTIIINDHLDEQQLCSSAITVMNNDNESINSSLESQKNHLQQLQLIQKLVETLFVAHESLNQNETTRFDKLEFQKKLNQKLNKLEEEQQQQTKRLNSASHTPVDSPQHLSLESNFSLNNSNRSPKHLVNNETPQSKFTVQEIRNMIHERNSLQSQIKFLEKQLVSYKLANKKEESTENRKEENKFSTENFKLVGESKKDKKSNGVDTSSKDGLNKKRLELELPVQGPMPKEPLDKLFPDLDRRNNSRFLKFFSFLKNNS